MEHVPASYSDLLLANRVAVKAIWPRVTSVRWKAHALVRGSGHLKR
jgi:hypothetical protein